MGALLKSLRSVFLSPDVTPSPLPLPPTKARELLPGRFSQGSLGLRKVASHPNGLFSFWVSAAAVQSLREDMSLSLEEITPLAMRIFSKCRELGLWHGKPAHFIMNVYDLESSRDWVACKIEPPMQIEEGVVVERAVTVYLPNLRAETEGLRQDFLAAVSQIGQFKSEEAKRAFLSTTFDVTMKHKHLMILAHEMTHVFATDEYYPIMDVLGLDRLELLTDAISVVALYPDYKGSDHHRKAGFVDGCGYIVNQLRAEQPNLQTAGQFTELCYQRARRIIRECQALLNEHENPAKHAEKGDLQIGQV